MVSPFLGGGLQLVAESQSGIGSSPLPTLPPAPTTPAGIVVIKNNVTLVVHHYVKEPDSDDTDVEEERGSNTSSNCSSDSETQQQGSGLPPAPPQPSAFLRCMAVICCMASAVPPQRRSRRRRRHSSRLMSATEAELAGHVIGPQAGQVDFRSKYQKAQAVTPIPVLKRTNSAGALTSLARTPLASTPQAVSRVGTGGGMMVGEPPGTGYSAGSRFSSYSVPPEVSSPLPRCNSLRSPADVRLSEVLGGGLPSAAAAGGGGTTPVIADAVGWSFVGALGVGGASGGGIAGGSPTGGGGLRVAGDSGGLSTISSFSGHLSSGRPSATQAPVLIAGSLVQCFQQLGQRAAGAGLEGGVGLAAAAQAPPAGPGVVVVKDAVKLVVHHYRAEDDSDENDASRQTSAASDGGPAAQPQGPQVSGLVRFLAVLCCMAPAQPQRNKKRRRRSRRKPSALSSEVLAPEVHLIGAHPHATDFKGKYQRAQAKAQALVPVSAIKRAPSTTGLAPLTSSAADPSSHGTPISGTATEGARTASGGPCCPATYQPSPFATHSMPNGASPVSRTTSLRSPGDIRLAGLRSSPMQSQSVDGYMDVGGWSPVGGGSGGGGLSGGSPPYTGPLLLVNGDSGGGLSRISSFDGRSSSGQPAAAAPAEPSRRLVQCLRLELVEGASASLDGAAGSTTPDALSSRHHDRSMTGGSVSGYGKRGVRWQ
ncbi:hypothetical protein HYH02_009447 [Chlamydomonas schloesseri]|uniref:Uncharacterized protein n=1 Tax=Chlamydomonas schloesseri TaxID=2026947 RepID=A0A835TCN4_9CHLO|nr:hypothetical protein HYH02_009447 [Chlamydomonas schloesseri]|eukprot:KAG2443032.1 hypothetical protein HYH02_009447 [Chlamydomonas schloesseri]